MEFESKEKIEIENNPKGDFSISGIIVMDVQGKEERCKIRTLLDTGAGTNFVAAEVLKYVRYERIATEVLRIQGIHTVERRNYELVKLFIENDNCEIKEIICYVMEDLGKVGYLVDRNKMIKVMEGV